MLRVVLYSLTLSAAAIGCAGSPKSAEPPASAWPRGPIDDNAPDTAAPEASGTDTGHSSDGAAPSGDGAEAEESPEASDPVDDDEGDFADDEVDAEFEDDDGGDYD